MLLPENSTSKYGAVADPTGGGIVPSPVSFTMPMPPSTNALFKNVPRKGRVKTKAYRDFVFAGLSAIRRQKVRTITGYVGAVFNIEIGNKRADLDNRLKAMLDVIVKAGVIEDDRFVTYLAAARLPEADGLAWVSLTPSDFQQHFVFRPSQSGESGGWFRPFQDEEGRNECP